MEIEYNYPNVWHIMKFHLAVLDWKCLELRDCAGNTVITEVENHYPD